MQWTETLQAAIAEAAPDGILVLDEAGLIRYSNPRLGQMLGYEAEEVLGLPVEALVPQHLVEPHRALRSTYTTEPHSRPMGTGLDLLARCKDGSNLPVEISLSAVEARDGTLVVVIVRDVSVQRQLLEAHREAVQESERAREQLDFLVQLSPVGIVAVDRDGAVTLFNDEARRLCGLGENQTPMDLVELGQLARYRRERGEPYEEDQLPLQRVLRTGERVDAEEVRFEQADGPSYLTVVSAARIEGSDGRPLGAVATIQDISERADAEHARAEFVAIVRHEIANPLTVIMGSASRGLRRVERLEASSTKALLKEILDHAVLIRPLLESLDGYVHLQSSKLEVNLEQIDLRGLLDGVALAFGDLTGRAADLELRVGDVSGELEADPLRVREVLMNLLSNAAKFSDPGTPIILTVDTVDTVDTGNVRLCVRDHGFGIEPKVLNRLFKPFTRLHLDRNIPGTGLGLAISRQLVEAHGGTIAATSDGPGAGSTMTVVLPRHPRR